MSKHYNVSPEIFDNAYVIEPDGPGPEHARTIELTQLEYKYYLDTMDQFHFWQDKLREVFE